MRIEQPKHLDRLYRELTCKTFPRFAERTDPFLRLCLGRNIVHRYGVGGIV